MVCCTCAAARKPAVPDWLALSVQVPGALMVTVPFAYEHALPEEGSSVIVTNRPEVDVAFGLETVPPSGEMGAVVVKEMVCAVLPTLIDCCTWGAAA